MKDRWQTKKLGEVCDIYQPKTISAKEMIPNGEYVVFGANGIIGRYDKYNHEDPQLLITCRGATCGSVNISMPKSWITGNAMVVRPKDKSIDSKYLEYIFRGGIDVSKVITGAAQPQITRANLKPVEISYPESMIEQKRIVKILDEVFDGVAKAKKNAEKNLQNAKELFDSYLQNVFASPGKGWEAKKLGELYQIGSSRRVLKSQWRREGVPFYRGREITRLAANGQVNNELFISEKHYQELLKQSGVPKPGDIVITAIGTIGNMHIVRENDRFYFKDASVLWMKRVTDVNSEFIKFWLKSSLFLKQLDRDNGATVDTLTIKKLQSVELYLPTSKEQQEIVNKFNALSVVTKRLEKIYEQKLADLEELKKSVLSKAFHAEL